MRTRFLIFFAFLTLIISCNKSGGSKTTSGQINYSIEKEKIKNSFALWQKEQIRRKRFWASDSCYPDWFENHEVNETLDNLIFGFPSDSSLNYSFADLNKDGILDGLVTFNPDQCDGGNASMWVQWQVFLLSSEDKYQVTDTIKVDNFTSTEFDSLGFYWLDGITTNKVFGTYYSYKEEDGRCCPTINRHVTFDFVNKKMVFIEKE